MDSQRWEQPHVLYGQDHILKVNKPKSRPDLIKEAKLASYLNERELPFKFSEPVEIHPQGYFAVFKRLDDRHLTPKRLNAYSPAQMNGFARSIGTFLSFLHAHIFPSNILALVPRNSRDLVLRWVGRAITYIQEYTEIRTADCEARVDHLTDSLDQRYAVTHRDFTFGNILIGPGESEKPSIIDFAESEVCDPSLDFAYFAEDVEDEGIRHEPIMEAMFENYQTSDTQIRKKAEFKRLEREIIRTFRKIRRSVRRGPPVPLGLSRIVSLLTCLIAQIDLPDFTKHDTADLNLSSDDGKER